MSVNMPDEPIDVGKWFIDQPEPPEHTYELALVLGGTVSAGCYTAGALDFLIEALNSWSADKDRKDPRAPTHNLTIRVIAGTFGCAVNAALGARARVQISTGDAGHVAFADGDPKPFTIPVNKIRLLDFLIFPSAGRQDHSCAERRPAWKTLLEILFHSPAHLPAALHRCAPGGKIRCG
jgi:predicted acylesterase/phospholipase RssA